MIPDFFIASYSRFCVTVFAASCFFASPGAAEDLVDFGSQIRPLLNEHCLACHGGVKQAADVSFIHRDLALDAIEPGHPEDSLLVDRIKSDDEYEVMPPPEHGHPLTTEQISLFERWIRQGANWEQPWGYETPKSPSLPSVSDTDWSRDPIDQFVLRRLEKESIQPAAAAPPEQWLRRATLDLTGLPPSPQAVHDFIASADSQGDAAYEAKVDELLADDGFGHRWASVWLDQIRYADSRGLGADGRRTIWKYRDWVIKALNDDMPFNEFTIKQIAGDLLPGANIEDRLATAANRLTQTNEEGGTDDEEFRISAVLDRVSTVWQTWQGVTFGCVQCHSHPYDPIAHDEFYKFAAFFNNTADCDLGEEWPTLAVPKDSSNNQRAGELDAEIRSLKRELWETEAGLLQDDEGDDPRWAPITKMEAGANKSTKMAVEMKGDHAEFFTIDTVSNNTDIVLTAAVPDGIDEISAVRVACLPLDPESAKADSEWGFVLAHADFALLDPKNGRTTLEMSYVVGDEPFPFKNPQESINAESRDGFAAYSRINYPRFAAFVLTSPVKVPNDAQLIVTLKHRSVALGAFALVTKRGHLAVSASDEFQSLIGDEKRTEQLAKLEQLQAERKAIESVSIPVIEERQDHLARPTHVFIRGLFLTKDKQVQPDVPKAFPPLRADEPVDRLTLARWLVSDENPLTARVTTNRVWARLFGVGIVATEEDFGSSGEPPSHPELLDHLAIRFRTEFGWRLKPLLRSIVLSSTYRQDATIRPELHKTHSQNRLLFRGPRFRLPAEIVRDHALFAAGLLSDTSFGAPVFPPIPAGIWKPFQGGDKWTTAKPGDPNRYRRSIYTYTKRSIPYPMFAAFDAPSREFCTPRRLRSNTPLQALMMLNDETFAECASALGKRMQDAEGDFNAKLEFGFLATTSRLPSVDEIKVLVELLGDGSETDYAAVASALLNLDEATNK